MSALEEAAKRVAEVIIEEARELIDDAYASTVWKAAKAYLPRAISGRPPVIDLADNGAGKWVARLMIFDPHNELVADSQPDADIDAEPNEVFPTIIRAGYWARDAVFGYHAELRHAPPQGLDDGTLSRRISGLRVQLSRHKGGLTWWKLPYTVGGETWTVQVRIGKASEEAIERASGPEPQAWRQAPPDLAEASTDRAAAVQQAFSSQED